MPPAVCVGISSGLGWFPWLAFSPIAQGSGGPAASLCLRNAELLTAPEVSPEPLCGFYSTLNQKSWS